MYVSKKKTSAEKNLTIDHFVCDNALLMLGMHIFVVCCLSKMEGIKQSLSEKVRTEMTKNR